MRRSIVSAALAVSLLPVVGVAQTAGSGLRAQIYSSQDLSGSPVLEQTHPQVQFDWGTGTPVPSASGAHFRRAGAVN